MADPYPPLGPAEPVAVIGAGAIGMFLAAALARAGHPLTVYGGRPIDRIEVTEGDRTDVFPVRHSADPAEATAHRLAVVAVKAHHTDEASPWLRAAVHDASTVLVAQNGIEHRERVAPYVGRAAVVPAIVYVPVERPAPGHAIVHRPADRDLTLPADPAALAATERLAAGGIRVENAADFTTAAWRKVLTNMGSNPITTLTTRRTEVIRDPGVARYALRLLHEAAAVARAEGAAIGDDVPETTVTWLWRLPDGSSTSMLQDRLSGNPLEHDALTGAILRTAARHHLDVPHIESLHALLEAISATATPHNSTTPPKHTHPRTP
ncbi:2-dehydropantoate 2-reductase [Streptomyces sp. NPDC093085]|uniref:ketopantoate reductase family protein n=1 Tax=Streptomyces sp. NPDC093085 TaxID=3155068 RepID=UPI00341F95E2